MPRLWLIKMPDADADIADAAMPPFRLPRFADAATPPLMPR